MVNLLEIKSFNDVYATTELYTELQELLQNKSLGLKQISALCLKQKIIHKPKTVNPSLYKKMKNEKSIVIKKSLIKSKIAHGKNTPA